MALRVRRGLKKDFDPNKLLSGELAILTDVGEMHYCFSAGNVKRLQTEEDLQNLLNASPEAYTALQQLIADLTDNPNELANILSNISTLQTDVSTLQTGKIDKTSIVQTDTVNDTAKVASAAVAYAHGLEIDALTDNLAKYEPTSSNTLNVTEAVLDNYIDNGNYSVYLTDVTGTDFAIGSVYLLEVKRLYFGSSGAGVVQRMTQVYPQTGNLKTRSYYSSGGWGAWV